MLSSEIYVHKHVCSIIVCINLFICWSTEHTSIALYFFKTGLDIIKILKEKTGLDIIKILKEKATLANKNQGRTVNNYYGWIHFHNFDLLC